MYKSRIFGTPPEPVFNMKSVCMTSELLEEALYVLADENERNMDDANAKQGLFKGGKTAGITVLGHFLTRSHFLCVLLILVKLYRSKRNYLPSFFFSEYVFLLCEEMGLPIQTRFLSIEIFDR